MKLSPRLQQVADFVPPGVVVADIGTDHALLPLYLLEKDISPRIVAVEAKEKPYKRAARNIEKHPLCKRVTLLLGDGLKPLRKKDNVSTAVLAGMGGYTVMRILGRDLPKHAGIKNLILQPMTHPETLRIWLAHNNLRVVKDALAKDEGRIYEIIAVEPGKVEKEHPYLEHGPGLIENKDLLIEEYIREKIRKTKIVLNNLTSARTDDIEKTQTQFEQRLEKLQEMMALVSKSTDSN